MTSRDTYISKMKLQLDELNVQMDKLEARAQEAREDVRDTYRAEMDKLHEQSKLALAKLDALQTTGENTWDAMVAETEKVRDAFVHSFRYFKSQV
ncbi:MAG: hypothetical protein KBF66_07415 [Rhodoferax sp.]|uniref:hypothetical protein n=1 Tax=Rhodoferax sp. TaxID=50421 RepID=UPI001B56E329|nr:hypothetical protein [Rhodoferax sp.]MBP9905371.1 hypothetical protein [Rhodoferax sp.]